MYELYIEGYKVDIDQKLSIALTYAIDDVSDYGSRETSFSKQIVIPGTAINNKIFGFIYDLASFNYEIPGATNIGAIFNVAQTSRAELRLNGLLVMKGVFRITNIIKDGDIIEYEGAIFGELSGFVAEISSGKNKKPARLEDLDFSIYNHVYTRNNIVNSWNGFVKYKTNIFLSNAFLGQTNTITVIAYNNSQIPPVNFNIGDQIVIKGSEFNDGTYTITNRFLFTTFFPYYYLYVVSSPIVIESIKYIEIAGIDTSVNPSYGFGYYYPLIDHGTFSTPQINGSRAKIDYDYRTFRPALFVKEYIDKMFENAGYTYESNFFNSSYFKKLIIPANVDRMQRKTSDLLSAYNNLYGLGYTNYFYDFHLEFGNVNFSSFQLVGGGGRYPQYRYTSAQTINVNINLNLRGQLQSLRNDAYIAQMQIEFYKNNEQLFYTDILLRNGIDATKVIVSPGGLISRYDIKYLDYNINQNFEIELKQNDAIAVRITKAYLQGPGDFYAIGNGARIDYSEITVNSLSPVTVDTLINNDIYINDYIPKNILQKDFFTWILKMFNLYITESTDKEKHLVIEPYSEFWTDDEIDWTYKVDRSKPWQIKPMGMLNGRFFEYKYKEDNDHYNERYKKKYNLPYGSRLEDTGFQFSKEKQTLEIGFSPTPLIQYKETDKIVPPIYKKSEGKSVNQEEVQSSNIRILSAKKMTGVNSWYITNLDTNLGAALTSYGYAGHFDDPKNPTKDLNFGACEEIYFDPLSYTTNNLFNNYWSEYIAEIADKDSKILTCYVHLTPLDIAQLDFSRPIRIDNVLFRINKIIDYDYVNNELVKVELLKIINNG
jgi:hypothetical protein